MPGWDVQIRPGKDEKKRKDDDDDGGDNTAAVIAVILLAILVFCWLSSHPGLMHRWQVGHGCAGQQCQRWDGGSGHHGEDHRGG
jgi:hypothetical protein